MTTQHSLQISSQQKSALLSIFAWLAQNQQGVFRLGGYAGTGKSTLMAVVRLLIFQKKPKWRIAFAAFTGKATQVLNTKLTQHQAVYKTDSISTLHALLYTAIIDKSGQIAGWRRKEKLEFDLLIIDEASMVTSEIWRDIEHLGIPVLAVGDHGQLPPVNSRFSLMEKPDFTLTQIHRQAAESQILQIADLARTTGIIPIGRYGPGVEKFNSQTSEAGILIEDFLQQTNQETLFLTGFNTSRIKMNISARAVRYRDPEIPEVGDSVVCLKNDWEVGIFNGMTGVIAGITVAQRQNDAVLSYEAEIKDTVGQVIYSGLIAAAQFNQAESLKFTKAQQREVGQLFDYGYCLTVHKAQGSQAARVVLIEERSKYMDDEAWRRWLYTGVTRAETELYIF